ncbi:hypothetical protein IFR05_015332, partial [Cadophora sp. M221]
GLGRKVRIDREDPHAKAHLRPTPPTEIIELEEAIRDQHKFMFEDVRAFLSGQPVVNFGESTPGRNRFFNGRASQATVEERGVWDWVNAVLDQHDEILRGVRALPDYEFGRY